MTSSPAITFQFGDLEYAVEERHELLGDLADRTNCRPMWCLSCSGLELVTLSAVHGGPRSATQRRFETWLQDNRAEVLIEGRTYHLYRLARDFFSPDKEDTPQYVSWVIHAGSVRLTQIACRIAPSADDAVVRLRDWLTAHPFPCCGGPRDGERSGDHGLAFRPFPLGMSLSRRGRPLDTRGRYVFRAGAYYWEPDVPAEA